MKWPAHGSNPQYLYEAMNLVMPEEKIDFSANINPLGPPAQLKRNWPQLFEMIADYPDPKGKCLRRRIAVKEDLNEEQILIGNGGAELISLVGRMLRGKRALIIQPAFSEYEAACRTNGCRADSFLLEAGRWDLNLEKLCSLIIQYDAVFLCNPCNPTGIYYSKSEIQTLAETCKEHGCLLIIDEAFYDFVAEYESITDWVKDYEHIIIIRSMTKMFAIPGLRLGYVMASEAIIRKLACMQPHWSMNALALKAGEWCLDSDKYIEETRELIARERNRLFAFFAEKHFLSSPSRVNFYLLKDPLLDNQLPLFEFFLQQGIIPRHTMNFIGLEGEWLRFAVKGPQHNYILMEALKKWRNLP